ncbi:MAG: hypothetical protein ACR2KV_06545 [Solirubrobacteraceae bacterium]
MRTSDAVIWGALAVAVVNGLVGAYGTIRWYLVEPSRAFWPALRTGQLAALAYAVGVGVLWLTGRRAADDLFYLYAFLPLAIGFVAEQLRVLAAEQVLTSRGLADAQEVGELDEDEQRSVVVAILRRELGVMAAAAIVVCFLALRAAGTAQGF